MMRLGKCRFGDRCAYSHDDAILKKGEEPLQMWDLPGKPPKREPQTSPAHPTTTTTSGITGC